MAMVTMTNTQPYTDASPLLSDPAGLRGLAKESGYLFFKGLLDPEKVIDLRRQVLETCEKHGWLKSGVPLMDGVAHPEVCVIESHERDWQVYYRDILRLRDFQALALDPAITGVLEKVFGEAVLPHSRNICRTVFPNATQFTTPPHQDHVHIGGTEETWTVWSPLGDCPLDLGGLAVAPGTHLRGLLDTHEAYGAGGRGVDIPEDTPWVEGAVETGDVIMLHSLVVHQGRDNVTQDRLRLSVDFRYQPLSHEVRADSMQPHNTGLTWDEVYRDWAPTDPVKYYWRDWKLNVVKPAFRPWGDY